jgi:peroxin-6
MFQLCHSNTNAQTQVRALTRKFNLSKTLDLESVVKSCPRTFTGADFYALCSLALMTAIKRSVKMAQDQEEKSVRNKDERGVCVEQQDFTVALSRVTPSVSREEIAHYRSLREKFSNGT